MSIGLTDPKIVLWPARETSNKSIQASVYGEDKNFLVTVHGQAGNHLESWLKKASIAQRDNGGGGGGGWMEVPVVTDIDKTDESNEPIVANKDEERGVRLSKMKRVMD